MDSCFAFSGVSPRGRCFHCHLGWHVVLLVLTTVNSKESYHIIKINSFHFHTMLFVFMLYINKAFLLYVKSIANLKNTNYKSSHDKYVFSYWGKNN